MEWAWTRKTSARLSTLPCQTAPMPTFRRLVRRSRRKDSLAILIAIWPRQRGLGRGSRQEGEQSVQSRGEPHSPPTLPWKPAAGIPAASSGRERDARLRQMRQLPRENAGEPNPATIGTELAFPPNGVTVGRRGFSRNAFALPRTSAFVDKGRMYPYARSIWQRQSQIRRPFVRMDQRRTEGTRPGTN